MIEAQKTHDWVIVKSDGTKVGLILDKDKNGKPQYFIDDDPYLPSQFMTGTPGYGNLPPEKELAIRQDDWRQGFGQEYYSSEYSKAYYSSIGADARFKGMGIAGPKSYTATKPTGVIRAITEFNDDLYFACDKELLKLKSDGSGLENEVQIVIEDCEDVWNQYENPNITQTVDTDKKKGTYSVKFQVDTAITKGILARETISEDISSSATLRYWIKSELATSAGDLKLLIGKGDNETWTSPTSDDTAAGWDNPGNAWDGNVATYAGYLFVATGTSSYLELSRASTTCSYVKVKTGSTGEEGQMKYDLDAYYGAAWHNLVTGASAFSGTVTYTIGDYVGDYDVTKVRLRFTNYNADAMTAQWYEAYLGTLTDSRIDTPALDADTWTEVTVDIPTPADWSSLIRVGLWEETDLGTEPYDIRVDNVRVVDKTFDANITDLEAFTDDRLYIALGADNNYCYIDTDELVTETNSKACFFKSVSTTMWKALLPRSMYSATAPGTNAGWSSVTTVGSSAEDITELEELSGSIYIFKEDMPYYIDSAGDVHELIPELKSLKATTSGKNALSYKGNIYIPCGEQALYEYDDGTVTELSPSNFCTNLSEFVGKVQALAFDDKYLFAITDNSTKVEILAGGWEMVESVTDWRWHPIAELTLAGCETAFVSSVYKKRLWVASTSSSDSLYYYPIPTGYGDITNDSDYKFLTGTYMITPWLHANFKADDKAFIKLALTTANTTAAIYITAYYRVLGQTTWTSIGNYTSPPVQSRYLPQYSSTNPVSKMIQFKFTFVTNDVDITPVLLSYDCRAILYPSKRRIINCVVRCADDILGLDGIKDNQRSGNDQNAAAITTALEAADDATWPQQIYDIDNTSTYVKFIGMRSETVKLEKDKNPEKLFYLSMQETSLS